MAKEISKPYPNFHSARVKAPGLFAKIQVLETTKTGVMLYGGAAKTQSIRFPKDKYSVKEAKVWLKEHKWKYIAFEEASEEKKKTEPIWPTITGE